MDLVDEVVKAIANGNRTNAAITMTVCASTGIGYVQGYNPQIDRAIQKAKKQGRIVYRERQWFVAEEPKPCSRCRGTGKEPR